VSLYTHQRPLNPIEGKAYFSSSSMSEAAHQVWGRETNLPELCKIQAPVRRIQPKGSIQRPSQCLSTVPVDLLAHIVPRPQPRSGSRPKWPAAIHIPATSIWAKSAADCPQTLWTPSQSYGYSLHAIPTTNIAWSRTEGL
jgi:hypothetical protein